MSHPIIPKFVFARYNESMDWIAHDPSIYSNCIIYNKGNRKELDNELSAIANHISIIDIPNEPIFGREGDTYLRHIINNFDKLDEYIIFSQADPFTHNPFFLETIQFLIRTDSFKNYQPLTYCWKIHENVPPMESIIYDKTNYCGPYKIYMETLDCSLRPVGFIDTGIDMTLRNFQHHNQIRSSDKILPWIYENLNLSHKPFCGFIKFNYGAIFGVSRSNILQNPIHTYKKLHNFVNSLRENGFILERLWYTLYN